MAESYPEFLVRDVAYFAVESWNILRENSVPVTANTAIAAVFVLGLWRVAEIGFWCVRRVWPVLVLAGGAAGVLAVLQFEVG